MISELVDLALEMINSRNANYSDFRDQGVADYKKTGIYRTESPMIPPLAKRLWSSQTLVIYIYFMSHWFATSNLEAMDPNG